MAYEIKGKNQSLQWLSDMMALFQAETIKTPGTYRERVLSTKNILKEDTSGLVNTMLDFAINCAMVEYKIETSNPNLSETLNKWLDNINSSLRGKIPTGLNALAKEYYRERWKGSSQMLMRTFWETQDELELPTTLFFLDGEDVKCKVNNKDGVVMLGEEKYAIRVDDHEKNDIPLPKLPNELIFVQKPYDSWSTREPVPFLIRKGVYHNLKFLQLMSSKGEYIVGKALEYLFIMKKGTERMALEGRAEMVYDENDLKQISTELKNLLAQKKNEGGAATYTTNFDTDISEYIPDYKKALDTALFEPAERRILAGIGMIDIVQGLASTRRESTLNPKPFMVEVNQGISDFSAMLTDILNTIVEKNKKTHPKWMGAKIEVNTTPIKAFIDDKFRQILRSAYDRGVLSKRTFVEVVGEMDYDIEVERRKTEKTKGDDKTMFPPVIQNQIVPDQQSVGPDGKKPKVEKQEDKNEKTKDEDKVSTEKKNQNASRIIGEPKDPRRKYSGLINLPHSAKMLWTKTFNEAIEDKDEDLASEFASNAVKKDYKQDGDNWIQKLNKE